MRYVGCWRVVVCGCCIIIMEELKVQNSLLLQLVSGLQRQINSKNRQNQILFQQYDQLAADNRTLQAQADQLRAINAELKRHPPPPHHHESPPRTTLDLEINDLKKRNSELQSTIIELRAHLDERGGTIVLLQEQLQTAKLAATASAEAEERFKEMQDLLKLKEQSVAELTQYMQEQSQKINDLTRAGIIAIDNYESKLTEKDTLAQTLTNEIAQLRQKIQKMPAEAAEKDVQREEKIRELEAIIQSKQQSIAELSEFLQMQTEKASKLESSLSESNLSALQGQIDNLKQIVESKQQSMLELSDFLNTLSNKNREMEEKLLAIEEKSNESPPQLDSSDVVASLQGKIEQLNRFIASQEEKQAQLSSKLQENEPLLKEVEILRAKLSTKEDQMSLLEEKLQDSTAQVSALRVQLDQKIVKITMLESISEQNDTEFPVDHHSPDQIEPQPVQAIEEEEKPDYQSLLQLKSNQIEAMKATIEQKDQSLRDFTDFISQQTDKISQLERQVRQEEEQEIIAGRVQELETIIKSKEQSISELTTFLEEAYAKNAETDASYRQAQEKLALLQQQLDQSKQKQLQSANVDEYIYQKEEKVGKSEAQPIEQQQVVNPAQQATIAELRDQIIELESTLASKCDTIAQLSEFMNEQAEELDKLRQHQGQGSNQSQKVAELEAIIKLKQQANTQLSAFLEEAYLKTAEIDAALAESQRNLQIASEQLAALRVTTNEGEPLVQKAIQEPQQVEQKQEATNVIQEQGPTAQLVIQAHHPQHSSAVEDLKNQIAELEGTLASKSDTIAELSEFMNQQAEELEQLRQQVEERQTKEKPSENIDASQDLRNQITELELVLASKNDNIAELTDFMSQQAEELEELRAKTGSIEGQSQANLQEKIKSLEDVVRSKEASQAEMGEFLQEAYSKSAALEEEKASLITQLTGKETEANELQSKCDELGKLIEELKAENQQLQQLKAELASKEETIKAINLQLNQAKSDLEKQIAQLAEKSEGQQQGQDVQTLKASIQDLEDVINSKSQTIAQLSEFMNEQSLRVEELEEQLNNTPNTGENAQSSNRNEELQQIVKSKEASITELTEFLTEAYAKSSQLQEQLTAALAEIEQLKTQQKPQVGNQDSNIEQQLLESEQILTQLTNSIVQAEATLNQMTSQVQSKSASISAMKAQEEEAAKQFALQEEKLKDIQAKLEEATADYNAQINDFNQQREDLQAQLENGTETLQEILKQIEEHENQQAKLKEEIDHLHKQISILKEQKNQEQNGPSHNNNQQKSQESESATMIELQAKIAQYEGYLNDKEEEMAAMMEVMETLQAEIKTKTDLIEELHQHQGASLQQDPAAAAKIQQLELEILNLKQNIEELQEGESREKEQMRLQGQYQRMQVEQQLREESHQLAKQYEQELKNMKMEQKELGMYLNLEGFDKEQGEQEEEEEAPEEEEDNNEELTVLQVIEQILVYSQETDMASILGMIEVLKRSYLRESQSILKENSELKDTLNNLLEINNNLVEEVQKLKAEVDQQRKLLHQQAQTNKEAEERISNLEANYQQEIKQLRKSISGLHNESPIVDKGRLEEEANIISRLEDEVILLRQENQQKEVELSQLRANSNKKFVNQLNNLLDSCTVAKEGEDLKEIEEQLDRVTAERDEAAAKCKQYETQIAALQKQCVELTASLESMAKNQPQASQIQNTQGQDSLQTAELLAGLEEPLHAAQRRPSDLEEHSSADKWRAYNEQLQALLQEKNAAISQLEETMLGLEKGYNSEIMNLRKIIAELKSQAIALRKSLYQANPNGVDIAELIKETFSQSDRDAEFYRPPFPTYTNSLFLAQPHNNSYYSDARQPRLPPATQYQRYFPPAQLNMGEKFMGRRCRHASPFSYGEASRATAWDAQLQRY